MRAALAGFVAFATKFGAMAKAGGGAVKGLALAAGGGAAAATMYTKKSQS